MIICYHRSSSIGTYEMCPMKYFFQYVLGKKDKTNRKAVLGTVVHRAMQILADKRIAQQEGKLLLVNDDIEDLSFSQCDDIEYITEICFEYYKKHEDDVGLNAKDLKTCINWVYKALAYNNGTLDPRNQDVYATELFFDITIDKPWAEYYYEAGGKVFSGNLSIKGTIDLIVKEDDNYFQVLDYKGLPLETPILTNGGWTTMGEIQEGDIVYDRFGNQTSVVAKSRVKNKECFKITFDDKSTAECDDEHYWTLNDDSVVQAPDLQVGMKIDVAEPLNNNEIDLPIDPYLLGVWLGDGRNRSCEITCGDTNVFSEIENRGYSLGVDQNRNDSERNCECRTVKKTTHKLKSLDLLNNKHIPDLYFKGSYEQRLDLLKGLMDSDGSVNPTRKQCVFMNCNKKLSEGVKFLLSTLGQRPYMCETQQKYKDGIVKSYPVFFRPMSIKPFSLDRKNDKILDWGVGNSSTRRIIKIEKIGKKKTQCISVDSPDATYLCTKNLIPTHNTGKRLNWATGKEKTYEDLCSDKQLLLYFYALKNMYPDRDFYTSIYYINDGGLFDIVFSDEDYIKAENMLRKRFEEIRSIEIPRQLSRDQGHWKCQKLCKFSEMYEDTGKTTCQYFHDLIQLEGIEKVVDDHANIDKIGTYGSGGGRLDDTDKKT